MKKHIIFDMDGTLIDSSYGIYSAFSMASEYVRKVPPTYENFVKYIGPPIDILAMNIYKDMNDKELRKIIKKFREEYDSNGVNDYKVYKGIPKALSNIKRFKGIVMSIVTNKPTIPAENIITKENWEHYFVNIIGIDYRKRKESGAIFRDKADAMKYSINASGIKNSSTYYIGDTPGDMNASNKNGVSFVAVKYGFHKWKLKDIKNQLTIANTEELNKLIENITRGLT